MRFRAWWLCSVRSDGTWDGDVTQFFPESVRIGKRTDLTLSLATTPFDLLTAPIMWMLLRVRNQFAERTPSLLSTRKTSDRE